MATLICELEGVRGRIMKLYDTKIVIITKKTIGSFLTGNITDGEKTIFLTDIVGVQHKKSGLLIGYLQFETPSMQMNNKNDNMFSENTFTYESNKHGITNELIEAIYSYIVDKLEELKFGTSVIKEIPDFEAMKADEQKPAKSQDIEEEESKDEELKEEEIFESIRGKAEEIAYNYMNIKKGVLKKYYGNQKFITVPEDITSIGNDAFEACDSLLGIIIDKNVTGIGPYAFNHCIKLRAVILGEGVSQLKAGAFSNCGSLSDIIIPASVIKIDDCAFEGCKNLTIHTTKGSYAEKFAKENNIEIKLIPSDEYIDTECPECGNTIMVNLSAESVECPWCNTIIDIEFE